MDLEKELIQSLHENEIASLKLRIRQLEEELKDVRVALEDATRRGWRNGW